MKFGSAGDVELLKDVAHVGLDRLDRDKQRLSDLSVAVAFGGELGDAAFARGQGVNPAEHGPPWLGAGGTQFIAGSLGEEMGAAAVRDVECAAKRLAARRALVIAAQGRAEVDQRARVLERCVWGVEHGGGVAQQLEAVVPWGEESERTGGVADGARGSPSVGIGEAAVGETARMIAVAELGQKRRGVRRPGVVDGGQPVAVGAAAEFEQVVDAIRDLALREAELRTAPEDGGKPPMIWKGGRSSSARRRSNRRP